MTAGIQDIVNAQGHGYFAELALAIEAVGHIGHKLFERFFHCVQNLAKLALGIHLSRRLMIGIPYYDDQVIKQVRYTVKRSLFRTSLPLVVSTWYAQALTALPQFEHTLAAATRPMARPSIRFCVARLLSANQVALRAQEHVVNLTYTRVLKYMTLPDPQTWKHFGRQMLTNQRQCPCMRLRAAAACTAAKPCGACGHTASMALGAGVVPAISIPDGQQCTIKRATLPRLPWTCNAEATMWLKEEADSAMSTPPFWVRISGNAADATLASHRYGPGTQ